MVKRRKIEEGNENIISTAIENAGAALENAASSAVTEYAQENVKYRSSAGLKETIIREELSNCCKWCHDLAGEYEYGTEPSNVYARHDNCKCIVLFESAKGKYQDVWSKKEYDSKVEARKQAEQTKLAAPEKKTKKSKREILQEQKSQAKSKNVSAEYRRNARPGDGKIIQPQKYSKKAHAKEQECAEWLLKKYGGEIELLNESTTIQASFLWNKKKWELKTPNTINGIDGLVRKGIKQIGDNPGGIVVDLRNLQQSEQLEALDKIHNRASRIKSIDFDVMVRMKRGEDEMVTVVRYKK